MKAAAQAILVVRLAARSLWAHRIKSMIVGSLMTFGTFVVVSGTAMLDSIETAMARSIIQSLAGHIQIYSADARDELAIYGGTAMSGLDYGEIPTFSKVKNVVEKVDNVKAVVPMGINIANMTRGSDLDLAFGRLRDAYREKSKRDQADVIPRIKRLLKRLQTDLANRIQVAGGAHLAELKTQLKDVKRALSDAFWSAFDGDPTGSLEFLDTRVAPAGGEGRLMYLRYVGTDLGAFAKNFDRFRVIEGQTVPAGKRGILINQNFADRRLKILAARLLDDLEKARSEGLKIKESPELESKARRLKTQSGAISVMLSPRDVRLITPQLKGLAGAKTDDFDQILEQFLDVDDASIAARHKAFYKILGPRIELYPFKIGDVVTIRAWTKSGYTRAANVKVYGTFGFRGLERSDLSGAANLVDMMTFRELYGLMSKEQRRELKAIRKSAGVKSVSRKNAENDLFGGGDTPDEQESETASKFSEFDGIDLKRTRRTADDLPPFSQADVDNGLALSIAVLVDDDRHLKETQTAIASALKNAGLKLKVVDWQQASGIIGQLFQLVRGVLYVAIFIIFAVALVIINNSMLMATLERVREIGTMRAIGAQRRMILAMFVVETFMLCTVAGGIGALCGIGLISWLGNVGIPAANDMTIFMFSGTRLYPDYGSHHVIAGILIILTVSLLATLWPARVATRIQPVDAMRSSD